MGSYNHRLFIIIPQNNKNRNPFVSELRFMFDWGIGIRTPTYRVRVCCATVTQFPNAFAGRAFLATFCIIAEQNRFVNIFRQVFLTFFEIFFDFFTFALNS